MVDTQDHLANYIGTYTISNTYGAPQKGTVNVPGMTTDGTWYVYSNLSFGTGRSSIIITAVGNGYFTWYNFDTDGTFTTQATVMRI